MTKSDQLTVGQLGEFRLIERLVESLPASVVTGPKLLHGVGDDAAVWKPSGHRLSVLSTDTMVERVHFHLDWTDWRSLGHKLLAVNLSDIAAMGADPVLATVTLGLRGSECVRDVIELYAGMADMAVKYGVVVAGGDIVRSPEAVTLSVTVVGEVERRNHLMRSGAQAGDVIAVSGTLGASAAGMALLGDDGGRRSARTADLLIAAHLRPIPRIELGRILGTSGASSAMDLSDGLLGDLPKILAASKVSAEVDESRVPFLPAIRALFPDRYRDLAMRGGEDYELLFTIPEHRWMLLEARAAGIGATITAIGAVIPQAEEVPETILIAEDGTRRVLSPGAFNHFGGE